MKEEVFAIKFGKKIVIGYEINREKVIINDKFQNSKFNYLIKIDDNTEIDVYEIVKNIIKENFEQTGNNYKITYIDEIFKIEVIKSGKKYLLEQIIIKLFEKN